MKVLNCCRYFLYFQSLLSLDLHHQLGITFTISLVSLTYEDFNSSIKFNNKICTYSSKYLHLNSVHLLIVPILSNNLFLLKWLQMCRFLFHLTVSSHFLIFRWLHFCGNHKFWCQRIALKLKLSTLHCFKNFTYNWKFWIKHKKRIKYNQA